MLSNLPPTSETAPERMAARHRQKEAARARLVALTSRSSEIHRHIEMAAAAFNGTPGEPASFDRLHGLLEMQAYRLAYWRTAFDEWMWKTDSGASPCGIR